MSAKSRRGKERSNQSLRRGKPFRTPKKTILILCEGEKTEPQYFKALRQDKRLRTVKVDIIPGNKCGSDPVGMVDYALALVKRRKKAQEIPYDEIWLVFDDDGKKTSPIAIHKARQYKLHVAFSNPCFELWYILHYQQYHSGCDRIQAQDKLKALCGGYVKSAEGMYIQLLPEQERASSRAKELRLWHKGNGQPETANPSTNVDELVNLLNEQV